MGFYFNYVMQTTMFQPKGGMDMIAAGFMRQIGEHGHGYNTKVTKLAQDDAGVTASWTDTADRRDRQAQADWCVCTIPLPVLSQLDLQVGEPMKAAIRAVPLCRRR